MREGKVMSDSWHSYPSIYALGHKALTSLFDGEVLIEEKVGGSQFSFGLIGGELRTRSKGKEPAEAKMFDTALLSVENLYMAKLLVPEWTYRAEYLRSPKHNALAYDRVPTGHLILFDINDGHESYLPYDRLCEEASRMGLEVVPRFIIAEPSFDTIKACLETKSVLGGQKIEGVVIKNYAQFGADEHALMGKFVSEDYKEVHALDWKAEGRPDIIALLASSYCTPARWQKAVQHAADDGLLEGSPRDIGVLIKLVAPDVLKECEDEIKAKVWEWAWPLLKRQLTRGL